MSSRTDFTVTVEREGKQLSIHPFTTDFASTRFSFRIVQHNDLEAMFRWRTSPEVTRFMHGAGPSDMQAQREWFARLSKSTAAIYYVLTDRQPESHELGYSSFINLNWEQSEAELGVVIAATRQRNRGTGTRVTAAMITLAQEYLGIQSVYLSTNVENTGALILMRDKLHGRQVDHDHAYRKPNEVLYVFERGPFSTLTSELSKDEEWHQALDLQPLVDL